MKFTLTIRGGAILAALLAFLLYLSCYTPWPYPGESSELASQVTGIENLPGMNSYLYRVLAAWVDHLPFGTTTGRLAALSVLCGSLAVGFMFVIGARLQALPRLDALFQRIEVQEREAAFNRRRADRRRRNPPMAPTSPPLGLLGWVAGTVSAAMLMVSAPFMFAATRTHSAAFDAMLFLAWGLLFLRFTYTGRRLLLYVLALTFPLVAIELPTMVWTAPLVGTASLVVMIYRRTLRWNRLVWAAGLALAGLTFALVAVALWLTWYSMVRHLDVGGLRACLWLVLRTFYEQMHGGLPVVGALLVLLPAAPGLIAFGVRPPVHEPLGFNVMLAWVTAIIIAVLLLVQAPITPWDTFGIAPLFVMPYVLAALWAGFLAARLAERALNPATDEERWIRPAVLALAVGLAGVILYAGVLNYLNFRPSTARPFVEFADGVIQEAGNEAVMIASSPMDPVIRLRARNRGVELEWLSPLAGLNPYYRNQIAGFSSDERSRALLRLEFEPYLLERFMSRPDFALRAVTLNEDDYWMRVGQIAHPQATIYRTDLPAGFGEKGPALGTKQMTDAEVEALAARLAHAPIQVQGWSRWIRYHLARMANNRGVWLENEGNLESAEKTYEHALRILPDNFSAKLNRLNIWHRQNDPRAAAEQEALQAKLKDDPQLMNPDWVMAVYGRIRDPLLLMRQGLLRASSGQTRAALSELESAQDAGASLERVTLLAADLLAGSGELEKSEKMLLELLEKTPGDARIRFSLARTRLSRGDWPGVEDLLKDISIDRPEGAQAMALRASAAALRGDFTTADRMAGEVIDRQPGHPGAWTLRASIALRRNDIEAARKALRSISDRSGRPSPGTRMAWAELLLREGQVEEARSELERAAMDYPAFRPVLRKLLLLDVAEQRRLQASRHVSQILQQDPRDLTANYILATMCAADGDYKQAEALLRFVMERERSPAVLNDLAWVLHMLKQDQEALPLAREAVQMAPGEPGVVDTCVTIEWALGQREEARRRVSDAWKAGTTNETLRIRAVEMGMDPSKL